MFVGRVDGNVVGQVHAIACLMMMQSVDIVVVVVVDVLRSPVCRIRTGFCVDAAEGIGDDATIETALMMMTTRAVASDVDAVGVGSGRMTTGEIGDGFVDKTTRIGMFVIRWLNH